MNFLPLVCSTDPINICIYLAGLSLCLNMHKKLCYVHLWCPCVIRLLGSYPETLQVIRSHLYRLVWSQFVYNSIVVVYCTLDAWCLYVHKSLRKLAEDIVGFMDIKIHSGLYSHISVITRSFRVAKRYVRRKFRCELCRLSN